MPDEQAEDGRALNDIAAEHAAGLGHQPVQPFQRQLLVQAWRALLAASQEVHGGADAEGDPSPPAGDTQSMSEALQISPQPAR